MVLFSFFLTVLSKNNKCTIFNIIHSNIPNMTSRISLPFQAMMEQQAIVLDPARHLGFPYRLYGLLEEAQKTGFQDIISWLPCGTAFKVHDADAFEDYIIPSRFDMTKYKSFQRQLNLYSIKQRRGSDERTSKYYFSETGRLLLLRSS
jgi:hypothetical protein